MVPCSSCRPAPCPSQRPHEGAVGGASKRAGGAGRGPPCPPPCPAPPAALAHQPQTALQGSGSGSGSRGAVQEVATQYQQALREAGSWVCCGSGNRAAGTASAGQRPAAQQAAHAEPCTGVVPSLPHPPRRLETPPSVPTGCVCRRNPRSEEEAGPGVLLTFGAAKLAALEMRLDLVQPSIEQLAGQGAEQHAWQVLRPHNEGLVPRGGGSGRGCEQQIIG